MGGPIGCSVGVTIDTVRFYVKLELTELGIFIKQNQIDKNIFALHTSTLHALERGGQWLAVIYVPYQLYNPQGFKP